MVPSETKEVNASTKPRGVITEYSVHAPKTNKKKTEKISKERERFTDLKYTSTESEFGERQNQK